MNVESIKKAVKKGHRIFGVGAYHELMCATDGCGHVCFVMLERQSDPPEHCFAWILNKRAPDFQKSWTKRVRDIRTNELSISDLRELLTNEFSAISESKYTEKPWHAPFDIDELIVESEQIHEVRNFNPYQFGPTYITCWWRRDKFFYLEAHLES